MAQAVSIGGATAVFGYYLVTFTATFTAATGHESLSGSATITVTE